MILYNILEKEESSLDIIVPNTWKTNNVWCLWMYPAFGCRHRRVWGLKKQKNELVPCIVKCFSHKYIFLFFFLHIVESQFGNNIFFSAAIVVRYLRNQNSVFHISPIWYIDNQLRTRWCVKNSAKATRNAVILFSMKTNIRWKLVSRSSSATCGSVASRRWLYSSIQPWQYNQNFL